MYIGDVSSVRKKRKLEPEALGEGFVRLTLG
jgi:hypothetical protein